jgi:hypothetical protein
MINEIIIANKFNYFYAIRLFIMVKYEQMRYDLYKYLKKL